MSFNLLVKQAFKNIANKFRLYLSLLFFLIIAFSLINGLTTFAFQFEKNFSQVTAAFSQTNFQLNQFKFLDQEPEDSTNQEYLFQLSNAGQEEFEDYLVIGLTNYGEQLDQPVNAARVEKFLADEEIIKRLGQNAGDFSLLEAFDTSYNDLYALTNHFSLYYSHNLLLQFLTSSGEAGPPGYLTNHLDGVQTGVLATKVTGTDRDHPGIQTVIEVNEMTNDDRPNPFTKVGFNDLYHYKNNKKVKDSSLPGFYVSANYLRLAKKQVGDLINLNVNSQVISGQIMGVATSNFQVILANGTTTVYLDQETYSQVVGPQYTPDLTIHGYLPIPQSPGVYDQIEDLLTAADLINAALLTDFESRDTEEKLFQRTNFNGQRRLSPVEPIDQVTFSINKYHTPQKIYRSLIIFIDLALAILTIVVAIFIIQESINSEKSTLWFLKALGEKSFNLSLVNAFSIVVPLLVALAVSAPGTMLIMWFVEQVLLSQYAFNIPWYGLTSVSAIILVLFLVITFAIFILINYVIVRGKGLSQTGVNQLSHFQIFLAKMNRPLLASSPAQFRIGFAFVRQNFAKNLVTFFLFTIMFTVTLFGVQFNHSIAQQKDSYAQWFGQYNAISTMYPKNTLTSLIKDHPEVEPELTYQSIEEPSFVANQKAEQAMLGANTLESQYNYDLFYLLTEYLLGEKAIETESEEPATGFVIDPSLKIVIQITTDPTEQLEILVRLSAALIPKYSEETIRSWNENFPTSELAEKIDLDLIKKLHPTKTLTTANLVQWILRQTNNLQNWQLSGSYLASLFARIDETGPGNLENFLAQAVEMTKASTDPDFKNIMETIINLYSVQNNTFAVKYPSFSLYFGNIVVPTDALSGIQIKAKIKGNTLPFYGLDPEQQPFTQPIKKLGNRWQTINDPNGVSYQTLDVQLSDLAKNSLILETGDFLYLDLTNYGLTSNYAFRISGFVRQDSVLNEGFLDKLAFYQLLQTVRPDLYLDQNQNPKTIDNTIFSPGQIPYFIQNLAAPHRIGDGSYVDDYLYKQDVFVFDQKTVDLVSQTFARTVDEYRTLVTRLIILLIVLAVALSLIIITLILLENKKTILLFKATGYPTQKIIWYLISGYLISALLAYLLAIGLSAVLISVLAPFAEQNIFLQLHFSSYWLFFLIGLFETIFFAGMVIFAVSAYAHILQPKNAFATL